MAEPPAVPPTPHPRLSSTPGGPRLATAPSGCRDMSGVSLTTAWGEPAAALYPRGPVCQRLTLGGLKVPVVTLSRLTLLCYYYFTSFRFALFRFVLFRFALFRFISDEGARAMFYAPPSRWRLGCGMDGASARGLLCEETAAAP